jgi:hypothetical protein
MLHRHHHYRMDRRRLSLTKRLPLALSAPLFALLVAAGCATDPSTYDQSWQGASYDEVVAQWGLPVSSSKLDDGTDVHLWVNERIAVASGSSVGFGAFGGGGRIGTGVGIQIPIPTGQPAEVPRCERRLYFSNGYVKDEEWLGAPDMCKDFKRR